MRRFVAALAASCALLVPAVAVAQEQPSGETRRPSGETERPAQLELGTTSYKEGRPFPLTLVNGVDFAEPFVPVSAARRGDWGRIVLDSALPYALLAASFDQGIDRAAQHEVLRWDWVGVDQSEDNYPLLFGLVALAGVSSFLPAPAEDADGSSIRLRLDRLAVFALGVGISNAEVEILRPILHRDRPNGQKGTSRPSGHSATAFASMAFLSDVLRDTLRPQDEPDLLVRIPEELLTAVPYLGGFYMALERVHGQKHFLTDTLLGGAIGAFTAHAFYAWSQSRVEQGRGWLDSFTVAYDPDHRGIEVAFARSF